MKNILIICAVSSIACSSGKYTTAESENIGGSLGDGNGVNNSGGSQGDGDNVTNGGAESVQNCNCGEEETCQDGECYPWECTPDENFCSNNQVLNCSEDGLSSTMIEDCEGQTCLESEEGTGCHSQVICTPSQTQCLDNGVQTCNKNGQWEEVVACDSTTPFCFNGVCTDTATPPSCQDLANCNGESCCTSPIVQGGTYYRTAVYSGSEAVIDDFRLDKYEVTVGRFRKFVEAVVNGFRPASGSGKHTHLNDGNGLTDTNGDGHEPGWDTAWNGHLHGTKDAWDGTSSLACNSTHQTWTPNTGDNENRPINCVNWYQSYAFCIWDGGFLPSEAEWGYAASGGDEQRGYPWGEVSPGTNANFAIYDCHWPTAGGSCSAVTNIAPVGSVIAGNGLYGQSDLAGNIQEWVLDWYTPTYQDQCDNCANTTPLDNRVLRGSHFYGISDHLHYYYRNGTTAPINRTLSDGFRCARSP